MIFAKKSRKHHSGAQGEHVERHTGQRRCHKTRPTQNKRQPQHTAADGISGDKEDGQDKF
jgi:hypothetical protein